MPGRPGADRSGTGPVYGAAASVSPSMPGLGTRPVEGSGRDQSGDLEPRRPGDGNGRNQSGDLGPRRPGDPNRPVSGQPGEMSRRVPGVAPQARIPGDVSQRIQGRPGEPGPSVPGLGGRPGDAGPAGRDVRPAPQSLADGPGQQSQAIPRTAPGQQSQAIPRTAPGQQSPPIPRTSASQAGSSGPGLMSGPIPHNAADLDRPGARPAGEPVRGGVATAAARMGAPGTAVADPDERDDAHGVPPGDLSESDSGGLGSELKAKLRSQRRLRLISLVSISVLVLGLLPLFFGVRAATRDPVFTSLDSLDVPAWAAVQTDDQSSGSRWCFLNCRFRERTVQSDQASPETAKAYSDALTRAGWLPWQVAACPEQPISDGTYTCWRRDEFTLDLWVRLPECAVDDVARQDPASLPSTGPDGVVETPKPGDCQGSTVSIKVQNAITDVRGKPEPAPDPGLIGETPDPVLSNDPLLDPTPSPS